MHPCSRFLSLLAAAVAMSAVISWADPDDSPGGGPEPIGPDCLGAGWLTPPGNPVERFGVIGDYGNGSSHEWDVAALVKSWNPTFIVTAGDNNYGSLDPNPSNFGNGKTDWTSLVGDLYGGYMLGRIDALYPEQTSPRQRFFPTVGNHDSEWVGAPLGRIGGYIQYFHANPGGAGRLPMNREAIHRNDLSVYIYQHGPIEFFVLDSDAIANGLYLTLQRQWMARRLAEDVGARWRMAVFHHSPYSSSAHGSHLFMQWPELLQVDAVLCGHDHVYERLVYQNDDGPPIFIAGQSGNLHGYGFHLIKPQSKVRYDDLPGALRVDFGGAGVAFNYFAWDHVANQAVQIDSYTLGQPGTTDSSDDYSFFAEAGMKVYAETFTRPQIGATPLDLSLTLFSPTDAVLATNEDGAMDGRNALLSGAVVAATGTHRLRISAETSAQGGYHVVLKLQHPGENCAAWVAQHLGALPLQDQALEADPDGDGRKNLVEYAFATDPTTPNATPQVSLTRGPAGVATIQFELPFPVRADVLYRLESSHDLQGAWTTQASRTAVQNWQSVHQVTVEPVQGRPDRNRVSVLLPPSLTPRQFFRLAVAKLAD